LKDYLLNLFEKASDKIEYLKSIEIAFSKPKNEGHGDLSTNVAMLLTKELKKNPRQIAQEIIDNLEINDEYLSDVEIAGPGFINFSFNPTFVTKIIPQVLDQKENFGRIDKNHGKTAIVEFVSANPTGPLTIGHGRNAVLGDTIASLLEYTGYEVDREYYFNNAGRQMRVLGDSVKLRYLELLGDEVKFPDDYYQGEYIIDIAKSLEQEFGDSLRNEDCEGIFKSKAEENIFEDIKNTLSLLSIEMKSFFNEHSLYTEGKIDEVLKRLKELDLSYEKDDAIWFKLTDLGGEQDKVIVKSTGEPTYRLPDIAYHGNKFERGYDVIVDLFGSDHSATYPDVLAGCKALGNDTDKVKVLIHQFVTIMEKGEIVKMSTRKANFITIDELVDEVGADVVRYFFIMRNMNSHLNFDIDLAKKQSDENPVFYLQYAHARISSILRTIKSEGLDISVENLNLLVEKSEINLCKKLSVYGEEVLYAAENYEPHKVANYLEELATLFHKFYTDCRIMGTEKNLAQARVALAVATQIVMKNGLSLLKISAPDKM
jgi:arginyl-tRNA synthetase